MAQIRFHQVLRDKIVEDIANEMERISNGYPDYAVYREQVGYVRALRKVLELADEVEKGMT